MKALIVLIGLVMVGCASTKPAISDFERANKALFYRTQTEREYIRLYTVADSLKRSNLALQDRLDQATRLLLITTEKLFEDTVEANHE